jgi:hypothetical protein
MNAVIFAGPSIRSADIAAICDALVLPPAAMGDVYRVASGHPRAIGIIDGYFEGAPSVWHKEILWAMAQGIAVFGAASMGALRAAELSSFGMRGIGKIFADYLSGRLEDDDEVAVEHGPAETGYITISEPMVNIRATLENAVLEGIVPESLARDLAGLAKLQFYKERNWDGLLRLAQSAGIAGPALETFAKWLPGNTIDRKRDDALQLAMAMAEFMALRQDPKPQSFALEWTVMWDKAMRSFTSNGGIVHAGEEPAADLVLDELRLDPDRFAVIRRGAIARKLLGADTLPHHLPIEAAALRQAITRFREKHGLLTRQTLMSWLSENGLDDKGLERLIEDEIRLDRAAGSARSLDRHILAEVRHAGIYPALARRAREKQAMLDEGGHRLWQNRLRAMQARLWYFESFLRRPLPDDIDQYAKDTGFADLKALDRAIAREFAFQARPKETGRSGA